MSNDTSLPEVVQVPLDFEEYVFMLNMTTFGLLSVVMEEKYHEPDSVISDEDDEQFQRTAGAAATAKDRLGVKRYNVLLIRLAQLGIAGFTRFEHDQSLKSALMEIDIRMKAEGER